MENIKISVIIPVYNAVSYISEAVYSALIQSQTGEILLIEDGSKDGSLDECMRLEEIDCRIKLLRHPDGKNLGVAASRNLGIEKSRFPYIAFLDADDFYLPGRFKKDAKVFALYPDADGVYDATGIHFQNESLQIDFYRSPKKRMYTLHVSVEPENLFEVLVNGGKGCFCTDGIVLKRALFERTGLFDPELKMAQDTHLWIRAAAMGRLYAGEIERCVSMARVHGQNRVTPFLTPERRMYQFMAWRSLVAWGANEKLEIRKRLMLVEKFVSKVENRATDKNLLTYFYIWFFSLLHIARFVPAAFLKKFLWSRIYHSIATCIACMLGLRSVKKEFEC